jgi:hypothetical protein
MDHGGVVKKIFDRKQGRRRRTGRLTSRLR